MSLPTKLDTRGWPDKPDPSSVEHFLGREALDAIERRGELAMRKEAGEYAGEIPDLPSEVWAKLDMLGGMDGTGVKAALARIIAKKRQEILAWVLAGVMLTGVFGAGIGVGRWTKGTPKADPDKPVPAKVEPQNKEARAEKEYTEQELLRSYVVRDWPEGNGKVVYLPSESFYKNGRMDRIFKDAVARIILEDLKKRYPNAEPTISDPSDDDLYIVFTDPK